MSSGGVLIVMVIFRGEGYDNPVCVLPVVLAMLRLVGEFSVGRRIFRGRCVSNCRPYITTTTRSTSTTSLQIQPSRSSRINNRIESRLIKVVYHQAHAP